MEQLSERLQTPISTAELERRWAAVRAAMERDKVDVLLMQNNSDQMGGYVKYFTDLPATNGYPLTVVFPRDDLMTLVSQGPFGGVTELNGKSDGTRRGVKRWYTTPSYSSCYYTAPYDPELAAKALEPYVGGTIGLVGTYQMSFAMVDYMQKGRFSNSKFVDASDMVDRIKVIKSAEEQDLVKRAAAMQDGAMRAAFACTTAISPRSRNATASATAASTAFICAPRCRPASRRSFPRGIIRTASSRKATRWRSWLRMPAPAACIPSSAAPVW
jgi:Xaa-Pro aminopeptidase